MLRALQGADPNVDGGRPLKAATEAGSVGCVRALLDGGADIHAAADCALRLCAAAGSPAHVKIMEVLLDRGADVHAKGDEALGLAVERRYAVYKSRSHTHLQPSQHVEGYADS